MDIKKIYESKTARSIFFGICIAIVALLIFQAGIFVGLRKAEFSERLGENYYRAFGPSRDRVMGFFREEIEGGHGASGKIVRIDLPTFVVAQADNTEKIVMIDKTTILRRFREEIKDTDLKVDDSVIVLGSPNEAGQIVAKFVRLIPEMATSSPTSTQPIMHN
ncbi:MAG: hypothetical protein PHV93_03040 [Candidatus Pacebacteria bacterium]|nr:hypothetical protein [Candidatus Paceibacterota bacterium]